MGHCQRAGSTRGISDKVSAGNPAHQAFLHADLRIGHANVVVAHEVYEDNMTERLPCGRIKP
jgi:hypothetical protein